MSWVALVGRAAAAAVVALAGGCADEPRMPAAQEGSGVPVVEQRDGPWSVTCLREDEPVFQHDNMYRVYRSDAQGAGYYYETAGGVRFRGRIGENVNCLWERMPEGLPAGLDEPGPGAGG